MGLHESICLAMSHSCELESARLLEEGSELAADKRPHRDDLLLRTREHGATRGGEWVSLATKRLVPRWSGFRLFSGFGAQFSAEFSVAPWSRVEAVGVYAVSWLLPRGVAPAVGWCPGGVSPAGVWDFVLLGGCLGLPGVCPASWSGACRCAGCVSSVAFLGSCGERFSPR